MQKKIKVHLRIYRTTLYPVKIVAYIAWGMSLSGIIFNPKKSVMSTTTDALEIDLRYFDLKGN